jgi:predicted RNase H-like HicB family nuclease
MNFYIVVLRQSAGYWVALCLENGVVRQEKTLEDALHEVPTKLHYCYPS